MAAQALVSPLANLEQEGRLDSWKEIAAFLRRGVRTVQRWEATEGLPVHRHQHAKLGSVYALKSEVAAWWESRSAKRQATPAAPRPATRPAAAARAAGSDRRSRMLVLPFVNLSGDAKQDYLSDGMTEEMINRLARLDPARLGVIARTTALSYKSGAKPADQIAAELDLDYILEGSVRASGDHIRVSAQLVDARENTHLWAENYDRGLSDVLEVQDSLAAAIAREVRLAITPEAHGPAAARTVDPEAYQAFLMGRYLFNKMTADSLAQSLEWFERAVAKDPSLVLAWAGIAQAYGLLTTVPFDALPPREAMPKAAAAARKALELDPSLPEAHAALGLVLHHYEWKWDEAERAYQRALELNPDYSAALLRYAWLLLARGRAPDALARISRAQEIAEELDPHLLVAIRATRAAALYYSRNFDAAIAECRAALALDKNDFLLHYILGCAQLRKGAMHAGLATFKEAKAAWRDVPLVAAGVGIAQAIAGRKKHAVAILERLEEQRKQRYIPAIYIGILSAALRDYDRAFKWLERAFDERADGLVLLNADPMVDGVRKEPRFQAFIQRMGLAKA